MSDKTTPDSLTLRCLRAFQARIPEDFSLHRAFHMLKRDSDQRGPQRISEVEELPVPGVSRMVFSQLEQAALKEDHACLLHAWHSLALHKPHKFSLFNLEELNSSPGQVFRVWFVSPLPVAEELRFELVSLFSFGFPTGTASPSACKPMPRQRAPPRRLATMASPMIA